MIEQFLAQAKILMEQGRYQDAEKILLQINNSGAANIESNFLLAEVYLQQDKFDLANTLTEQLIQSAPNVAVLFHLRSRIALQNDQDIAAEIAIDEAIRLEPDDADYHAFKAYIKLQNKQFDAALQGANRALALDAENLLALNTRSSAMVKLGRNDEVFQSIETALRQHPNDPYTHANYGWGLLERGEHEKAKEHFKESLQHDPNSTFAQSGLAEAIKATNPLYRLFLKYSFFMTNLTSQYQWAVVIGFYVVFRVLRNIARHNEVLGKFITPILILLGVVALSTWVLNPIGNLFLRFNRYGKYLLTEKERLSSNLVGGSLAVGALGLLAYFATQQEAWLAVFGVGFAMILPFGSMFNASKNKWLLPAFSVFLGLTGMVGIASAFSQQVLFNSGISLFVFGFVVFQWVANFASIQR
jgi:tetratricopeptide (TPR) repeat protein